MKHLSLLAFAFTSCTGVQTPQTTALDGIWMSDGYGLIAEIENGRARSYQIAGDICIPDSSRWERLSGFLEGIDISPAPDGQTALVAAPYAQHRIRVNRLPALPASCQTPVPDTPEGNFEAFAAFFAANYAFFDLYGVDWDRSVAAARQQVRPDMDDAALFGLMAEMMAPLRDGHLELEGSAGRQDLEFEPNVGRTHLALAAKAERSGRRERDVVDAFRRAFWVGNVRERILRGEGQTVGNGRIQYGMVEGDIGYIALVTVAGYESDRPDPDADLRATNQIMEDAITAFQSAGARAVIVDLSVNYGGFDFVSRAIAERFAAEPTYAYTKFAGDAEEPIRTRVMLSPNTGARFEGPVYVMTSNITISGGEILTMALRSLPNVTHVGEATRGALSDVLDRTLPNGWDLSLSNEVYLDHAGVAWEGRGIRPEIALDVFPDHDPIAGHWAAVQELLARIGDRL